jgi:hypothetical protein
VERVVADAGRAQVLPPGMLGVLQIHGLVDVAAGIELVAAHSKAYLKRFHGSDPTESLF